jgi:hypothetical protein
MVQKFLRKRAVQDLFGFSNTEWDKAREDGRISAPDAWLGPRQPVWLETTVARDQERLLNRPKPIETRPTRRRKAAQAEAAA